MDRNFTIAVCTLIVCLTAIIINGCQLNFKESMKCADQGGSLINSRCWSKEELKK